MISQEQWREIAELHKEVTDLWKKIEIDAAKAELTKALRESIAREEREAICQWLLKKAETAIPHTAWDLRDTVRRIENGEYHKPPEKSI